MDKVFKISSTANGLSEKDIEKINDFLGEKGNDDFEITKIKELRSGDILITVSDM